MTRAEWFAQYCSGGWRKARRPHACDQVDRFGFRCRIGIMAGESYFDTNQVVDQAKHTTKRLCAHCANQTLKGQQNETHTQAAV